MSRRATDKAKTDELPRRAMALALGLVCLALIFTSLARAADRPGFADLMGDRRVLAIFAKGDGPKVHLQMAKLCHHGEAMAQRDLSLFLIAGEIVWTLSGDDLAAVEVDRDADRLRGDYGVAKADYRVLLLDKDGQVLLRAEAPVPAERVFAVIDRRGERPALAQNQAAGQADNSISTCAIPSSS